ncbi:hypothetical protein UPYG_G00188110 [Umbra pygmaea]|uniref:Lipoxygenase domain-containing protein n=1 Tax=Umbra pygmaea TaxID=75934 RepID=A0ABD0XAT6_UMBPY
MSTCKVSSKLGRLVLVELQTKPFCSLTDVDWFCNKVVVTTPEGDTFHFPCYRSVSSNNPVVLRDAVATLVFNDTDPVMKHIRKEELKERRQAYRWSKHADGLPESIATDNTLSPPWEVQFSFHKATEFLLTNVKILIELKLERFFYYKKQWASLDEISQVFCGFKTDVNKYVEKHWKEDTFFGYQYLNGINPMMIRRCDKLPKNFRVTEEMVKASLRRKCSLKEEIRNGNIFLVDYKNLDEVPPNSINGKQQYIAAPFVLLYKTPDDTLTPIAIQLKQTPGDDNPIFLPTDDEYDWLIAKIFVRSADFAEHELNFHLLRTHLLSEVFAMATFRNMPMVHPLYKLLMPHFRYTLEIDTLARSLLISNNGVFSQFTAVGGPGLMTYMKKAVASVTYSSLCLPEDIAARGLEFIPNYYYRDDGLKLWGIINRYVKEMVEYYYHNDEDVAKDTELQCWINEIFDHGFLSNKNTGIPQHFRSVSEVTKFLTMVIFNASVQHAAVNNGQFDFDGWMPNAPFSLQHPPPTTKGQSTEETMLETFPDVNVTMNGMATLYLLSKQSTDFVPFGEYKEELFSEKTPQENIKHLKKNLQNLKLEIKSRNVDAALPYTYLNPEHVENSVTI